MTVTVAFSNPLVSEESDLDNLQMTGWRSSCSQPKTFWGNPSLTGLRSTSFDSNSSVEEAAKDQSPEESEKEESVERWRPCSYVRLGELGRGSFGIVYKCLCVDTNRYFVAKEMEANDVLYRQLAVSEVNLLKSINHNRIISYYESSIQAKTVTLFAEFMTGGSLLQTIKNCGPLMESTTIKYARQIIEALAYIHKLGMVHNDLKCDNLLLDHSGDIKLSDFGSAVQKTVEGGTPRFSPSDAQFGVSIYWSAPEVLNYEEFTCSADIWSLGCTIVEMLSCEPPFYKLPQEEYLAYMEGRILSYDPKYLVPNASTLMQHFLTFLLQENSDKRPQTGSEAEVKLKQTFWTFDCVKE